MLNDLSDLWAFLLVVAAIVLVAGFQNRRRIRRELDTLFPDDPEYVRRSLARMPFIQVQRRTPEDMFARTHQVVVPPLGDGRPGESFWASGKGGPQAAEDTPNGMRHDTHVVLAEGVHLLVVSLGHVGRDHHGMALLPAAGRAAEAQADCDRDRLVRPVERVDSAGGVGWRWTSRPRQGDKLLTDTHIDHDGWAFIVGVVSLGRTHDRAVEAVDAVLASWEWIPVGPATPRP